MAGRVFSSCSEWNARFSSRLFATIALLVSLAFPNVIALVGHDCWQAVCTSPSAMPRFSSLAVCRAPSMRWTQNVHFSITP